MATTKINDKIFSYEYIENIVNTHDVVFVYFYNKQIKIDLKEIMNKNIKSIENLYNPNVTLLVDVKDVKKIETILEHPIKLPTILVFENKEISEFLIDAILIEK